MRGAGGQAARHGGPTRACALRAWLRPGRRSQAPGDLLAPQVSERFAHQLDYLDHYADDAAGRFARFRDTPVAVLGDDALARWAALGLLRNGSAAVAITEQSGPYSELRAERHGVEGGAEIDAEAAALAEAGCAPGSPASGKPPTARTAGPNWRAGTPSW